MNDRALCVFNSANCVTAMHNIISGKIGIKKEQLNNNIVHIIKKELPFKKCDLEIRIDGDEGCNFKRFLVKPCLKCGIRNQNAYCYAIVIIQLFTFIPELKSRLNEILLKCISFYDSMTKNNHQIKEINEQQNTETSEMQSCQSRYINPRNSEEKDEWDELIESTRPSPPDEWDELIAAMQKSSANTNHHKVEEVSVEKENIPNYEMTVEENHAYLTMQSLYGLINRGFNKLGRIDVFLDCFYCGLDPDFQTDEPIVFIETLFEIFSRVNEEAIGINCREFYHNLVYATENKLSLNWISHSYDCQPENAPEYLFLEIFDCQTCLVPRHFSFNSEITYFPVAFIMNPLFQHYAHFYILIKYKEGAWHYLNDSNYELWPFSKVKTDIEKNLNKNYAFIGVYQKRERIRA